MTNREIPEPADLPAGEAAPASPEELGHLVKGLDYSGVVNWAKGQDIPGYKAYDNMVGSKRITIDGLVATVGWVKHREPPKKEENQGFTHGILVDNPGGEDVVVVEGSIIAKVTAPNSHGNGPITLNADARAGRLGFMQFNEGDTVFLGVPWGQETRSWYVCFYPEAELSATTA
jgi:hypothetical protein